jgi:hypothetical protein
MIKSGSYEPKYLATLKAELKEGRRISLKTKWDNIPDDKIVVIIPQSWENCTAVRVIVVEGKTVFEHEQKQKPQAIYLLPQKVLTLPAKREFRNLSEVFS